MQSLNRLTLLLAGLLSLSAVAADKAADREALKAALIDVVKRTPLSAARLGVSIQSLDDGQVVYSHRPDELLNPASNVKLVTAAAALATLGPAYRFNTEFLTDAPVADGKAKILYVRGGGDPSINTERLYGIVSEILHTGLKEIAGGGLVLDDHYFDEVRIAPGFDQEDSDRAYMAPTGALSLNSNSVGIYLLPGKQPGEKALVEMEPPSDFFVIDSQLVTGTRRNRRFSVSSDAAGERQKIVARGLVPDEKDAIAVWKKIDSPPFYFGFTLKQMLEARGVKVKGPIRLGRVPGDAKLLHIAQSETLDMVLKRLNKNSSNFFAEQLIKTMGAVVKGEPGSHEKGIAVVEDFLEKEVGLSRGSYVMKNGSGLNDTNRFSATELPRLLRHMYLRFPLQPEYLSSLGIAGKDGTLKYRFEGSEAVGRLRAKTGTLENVTALSGYVQSVGGERFIFSVMVNDYAGRASPVIQGVDALGAAVAAAGSLNGPKAAVAQTLVQESVASPLDEAKSRVRTYLAMGKQQDKRNVAFLRTAWRNEKDPAVRAVVAESIYLSDPDDYLGVRTLIDSFGSTPEVYGRLRVIARDLSVEVPGVSAIVDIAASGNREALSKLCELARAADDDKSKGELQVALAEVAKTAPEELLISLKEAKVEDRSATVTALARGLVRAQESDHPFWKALRRQKGSLDITLAAFAQGLDQTLSQQIAAEKAPKAEATASGSGG